MSFEELLDCLAGKNVILRFEDGRLRYNAPEGVLTAELRAELSQHKSRLVEHLSPRYSDFSPDGSFIISQDGRKYAPSFSQRQLWFHHQLHPDSAAYHMQHSIHLRGLLQADVLERCLRELVTRHESLRTTFSQDNDLPVAEVTPEAPIELKRMDLGESLPQSLALEAAAPFDLATGPLIRFCLFRIQSAHHLLTITLHHMVADGWSMGVFFRELSALYAAFLEGRSSPLPPLTARYADFACWQHQWLRGKTLTNEQNYWRERLEGTPPSIPLPFDHPRPRVASFRGGNQMRKIAPGLGEALKSLSQREGSTLFITLLAAFKVLLMRYSGQEDVVVGSPFACRNQTRWENIIGFFANSVVLRTDLSGSPSFVELLRRVRTVVAGALAHQNFPFEMLVEMLHPSRNASYNPIFQVMFDVVEYTAQAMKLPGLVVEPIPLVEHEAKFDLNLTIHLMPGGMQLVASYSTDLFEGATVSRLLEHYERLLEGITADAHQSIITLPLLSDSEKDLLVHQLNSPDRPIELPGTLTELLEQQAQRTPGSIALEHGTMRLSYSELCLQADRLARTLRTLGVRPGMRIGICLERSVNMILAVFAVLKAGGTYVPLNPSFPQEQLAFMIEDIQAPLILTQHSLMTVLAEIPVSKVCLDGMPASPEKILNSQCDLSNGADPIAYIIYTSGSTGRPKGVMVSHSAVLNYVAAANEHYRIQPGDRVLQFAPFNFDASIEEIFCTLTSGATLVLRTDDMVEAIALFLSRCQKAGISVLSLPTAFWHELVQVMSIDRVGLPSSLRLVIIGGERALPDRLSLWKQHCPTGIELLNTYGPTEATVVATIWRAPSSPSEPVPEEVPIGRPLANVQAYLLDKHRQLVPRGVVGELCLGGAGLAKGYFNRSELTQEKFISHPFEAGERIYRTGDLARWLPDGNLVYCGRIDDQIKIRGFRVELGEIENVLQRFPGVRDVVVAVREDPPRGKVLTAYLVPKETSQMELPKLRSYLKEKLPPYMLPAAYVFLEQLPLSRNGKVDRKALSIALPENSRPDDTFISPRDALEIQLAKLWKEVLGVKTLGVRDNFFELGGHSLLAVRLFSKLEKLINRSLPLATLFQAPTVEGLARVLRDVEWSPPWSPLVPIKASGNRLPFYCVHGVGGNIVEFLHLSRYMAEEQPLYGIQAQGLDGKAPWLDRVEEMAALYVKEVRAFQPQGPYYLGGASFGGLVAYEMAQQLQAQGQAVALLALFDTNGPGYPVYRPGLGKWRRWAFRQRERVELHWNNWRLLEAGEPRREFVQDKLSRLRRYFWKKGNRIRRVWRELETHWSLPKALRLVRRSGSKASVRYLPQPYTGMVTLFRATEQGYGIIPDRTLGWGQLVRGELKIIDVPGYHGTIIREPRVGILAKELNRCLEQAQQKTATATPITSDS